MSSPSSSSKRTNSSNDDWEYSSDIFPRYVSEDELDMDDSFWEFIDDPKYHYEEEESEEESHGTAEEEKKSETKDEDHHNMKDDYDSDDETTRIFLCILHKKIIFLSLQAF